MDKISTAKEISAKDRELILSGKKRFLSEPELALYLGRSTRWLRYLRKRRVFPFSKIGSAVRYETEKVNATLSAMERPSLLTLPKGGKK